MSWYTKLKRAKALWSIYRYMRDQLPQKLEPKTVYTVEILGYQLNMLHAISSAMYNEARK